ncbi:MAG: hypothetical protein GX802_02140 [Clostridiales bacterium]|jgi:hypothetical protein|nr:hypothetical protein [Clostridiales bacterium]
MKLKEIFNKAKEKPKTEEKDEQTIQLANQVANTLEALKAENKLAFEIDEYISSNEFLTLGREFDVNAAIRIFEAEKKLETATMQGKQSAIDEIYRRREMPRAMKSGKPQAIHTDFSKISKQEFERIKKQLEGA